VPSAGQVTNYLNKIKESGHGKTLLILDFEEPPVKEREEGVTEMSLHTAVEFIRQLKHETGGKTPVLYTGSSFLSDRIQKAAKKKNAALSSDELACLQECPLWLSAFDNKPVPVDGFQPWTMWQYSDHPDGSGGVIHYYAKDPEKEKGSFLKRKTHRFTNAIKRMFYPHTIAGFNGEENLEMNVFKGSNSQMADFWQAHSISH
jgi:hypothetical protein